MTFKTIIPSYLENNHIDSLRYQLCELIYDNYKYKTFILDNLLIQKKEILNKVSIFIKEKDLLQYKENNEYWYPYKKVNGNKNLHYNYFFPNTDGEITYFCREGQNEFDSSEYLLDPVKLQFILMVQDIQTMHVDSNIAKEIIQINNQLFKLLFDCVGDVLNYSGLNTLAYIHKTIQDRYDDVLKIKNDSTLNDTLKNQLLRSHEQFEETLHLYNEAIIICNEHKFQKNLPVKENIKRKKTAI